MRLASVLVLGALGAAFATPATRAAPPEISVSVANLPMRAAVEAPATSPVPEPTTTPVPWCETDNDLPCQESFGTEERPFEGPANNGLIGIGGGAGGAFRSRLAHR